MLEEESQWPQRALDELSTTAEALLALFIVFEAEPSKRVPGSRRKTSASSKRWRCMKDKVEVGQWIGEECVSTWEVTGPTINVVSGGMEC
jgi:hypothetical protein